MKKLSLLLVLSFLVLLVGCRAAEPTAQIVATTKPVYDFTRFLCRDTDITVGQLITENVSCLHDYSLSVGQVRQAEGAEVVVISGGGLEEFMDDLLHKQNLVIDSSLGIEMAKCDEEHDHEHHHHEADAHIWLAPDNAKIMAHNISAGLSRTYPEFAAVFQRNEAELLSQLDALQSYGDAQLHNLSCRELITFHDGFGYLAHAFDLTIVAAMEEESGSEASAKELIQLISLVEKRQIPAVFAETHGSLSAPQIISAETGVPVYLLNMGMGDSDYFETIRTNIDTLKEALG
ncbi:MAG: zinc ABC transporter substrate-binding protein [Ruminococcaceae bacterium]|nr:zinc ABC transporter substrate-binding protein [Oscillospiraceae bacterium]